MESRSSKAQHKELRSLRCYSCRLGIKDAVFCTPECYRTNCASFVRLSSPLLTPPPPSDKSHKAIHTFANTGDYTFPEGSKSSYPALRFSLSSPLRSQGRLRRKVHLQRSSARRLPRSSTPQARDSYSDPVPGLRQQL